MKILKNKEIDELLTRVGRNYLIAIRLLGKALDSGLVSPNDCLDLTEQLIENSLKISEIVGGLKTMLVMRGFMIHESRITQHKSIDELIKNTTNKSTTENIQP